MTSQHKTNYVEPPSVYILNYMKTQDIGRTELAKRTGWKQWFVKKLLENKTSITENIARKLERAIGMSAKQLIFRENNYKEWLQNQIDIYGK